MHEPVHRHAASLAGVDDGRDPTVAICAVAGGPADDVQQDVVRIGHAQDVGVGPAVSLRSVTCRDERRLDAIELGGRMNCEPQLSRADLVEIVAGVRADLMQGQGDGVTTDRPEHRGCQFASQHAEAEKVPVEPKCPVQVADALHDPGDCQIGHRSVRLRGHGSCPRLSCHDVLH